MCQNRKEMSIYINCHTPLTLSPISGCKIITEISKYIIYHKLIPYPYNTLQYAAQSIAPSSVENPAFPQKRKTLQIKRHYKMILEAYENFESIFQNIQQELQNCAASEDEVEEVVLLIGATTRSPQELYRFILPALSCKQPERSNDSGIMLHLIRKIVFSEDFSDMLSRTMNPTNMYVMLKKKYGKQSDWFLPKASYKLPRCKYQAVIDLTHPTTQSSITDTVMEKVTSSSSIAHIPGDIEINLKESNQIHPNTKEQENDLQTPQPQLQSINNLCIVLSHTEWFQSRVSVKGFKCNKALSLPLKVL